MAVLDREQEIPNRFHQIKPKNNYPVVNRLPFTVGVVV